MTVPHRCLYCLTLALALALASTAGVRADFISGSTGLNGLGQFQGEINYTPVSATEGNLILSLTNTSAGGNGGYLTAFAFNNPGDLITGISLTPSDPDFGLVGSGANSVGAGPHGQFDFGVSTGSNYEGGGAPSKGIAVGDTATFTFQLTGTGLDALTTSSFFTALSVPPGAGEGVQWFVARFRGFNPEGSDKVPAGNPGGGGLNPSEVQTPEPGSLALAALGSLGFAALAWRRRRARATAC